jgi:hypothetical protein
MSETRKVSWQIILRNVFGFQLFALFLLAFFSFSGNFYPKGLQKYCFSNIVRDTSDRFSNYLLLLDFTKKTFRYEVITQSLSVSSKWVVYSVYSGKTKQLEEDKVLLNANSFWQRTKFSGHTFDEKKSADPKKLVFDINESSLVTENGISKINLFSCSTFPADSLNLFYTHWKN